MPLPSCGLYRTTREVAGVPAGLLVYFHNHGDPGPGLYLPESWALNRAHFSARGHTLGSEADADALAPLPAEGFYRVRESFFCCVKQCRRFDPELFVQLGYDASATPILFVPEWTSTGFAIPSTGGPIDTARLAHLAPLKVSVTAPPSGDRTMH